MPPEDPHQRKFQKYILQQKEMTLDEMPKMQAGVGKKVVNIWQVPKEITLAYNN